MSLILTHSTDQREFAKKNRTEEQAQRLPEIIITEIREAGTFYPAER